MTFRLLDPNLAAAGTEIVTRLRGRWIGTWGMCHCPCHDDRTASLSVRIGQRSLLFKCFAGCATEDILRALRSTRLAVPTRTAESALSKRGDPAPRMDGRIRQIWDDAFPLSGTTGARYLAQRGLAPCSAALRYNPRTPLGQGYAVRYRPAVIAAIRQGRDLVAIQRLFLERDGKGLAGDLDRPKLTLGSPRGGAVQLEQASRLLGLAEGIETAMAATVLLQIPVWATLGSERLHQILIPGEVRKLVLLPDNDRAGRLGLERARRVYGDCNLELVHRWPWGGLNDWSDVLAHRNAREGREGG